jgi:hypothetical protein
VLIRRQFKRHESMNFHITLSAILSPLHHLTDTHSKCCIVGVFGAFSHTDRHTHTNIIACLYMRVACAVIHVMRGRSWLVDLRTDNKCTMSTLGNFVKTYPTGRSHSVLHLRYTEIKSRLSPMKCMLPFSPESFLISYKV